MCEGCFFSKNVNISKNVEWNFKRFMQCSYKKYPMEFNIAIINISIIDNADIIENSQELNINLLECLLK